MLLNDPAEYPEPDKHDALYAALLHEPECNKSALPRVPPPQKHGADLSAARPILSFEVVAHKVLCGLL